MMNFSTRLKQLREEKKLRQEDLATILNISRQAISNYEQGTRFPKDEKLLIAIANYFNVSTDYLLGRSQYANISSNSSQLKESENIYYKDKKLLLEKLLKELEGLPVELIGKILILVQSIKAFYDEK